METWFIITMAIPTIGIMWSLALLYRRVASWQDSGWFIVMVEQDGETLEILTNSPVLEGVDILKVDLTCEDPERSYVLTTGRGKRSCMVSYLGAPEAEGERRRTASIMLDEIRESMRKTAAENEKVKR